jgi:hypothetical protein
MGYRLLQLGKVCLCRARLWKQTRYALSTYLNSQRVKSVYVCARFDEVSLLMNSKYRGRLDYGAAYRGADKSLARTGRKQATATEDSEFHISYL